MDFLIILQAILYVLVFFLGASIGSFGLVIVRRGHNNDWTSWLTGKSFCESCKKTLKWWELVPFVSYIVLGGKCSKCKTKIDPSHFLGETICGFIYVILYWMFHNGFISIYQFAAFLLIHTVLWMLSVSDFLYREINVLPVYILSGIALLLNCIFNAGWIKLAVLVVLFVVFGFIGRKDSFEMFGSGDIDVLLMLMCLVSGASIVDYVISLIDIIIYACLAGIVYFLIMCIKSKEKQIPFVPCLYLGYIVSACGVSLVGRLYNLLCNIAGL